MTSAVKRRRFRAWSAVHGPAPFRADLFHRLNVYPIHVPPLRQRTQDIPLLAGFFCEQTQRRLCLGPVRLDPDALDALSGYAWPGNVRELENVISRAVLKASAEKPRGEQISVGTLHLGGDLATSNKYSSLPPQPPEPDFARALTLREETKKFQRRMIQRALALHGGNWARAARDLGMHRSNLHNLASRLGLR